MNFQQKAMKLVHGRQRAGVGDGAWETTVYFRVYACYIKAFLCIYAAIFPVQTDIIVSWPVLQHQLSCHVGRTGWNAGAAWGETDARPVLILNVVNVNPSRNLIISELPTRILYNFIIPRAYFLHFLCRTGYALSILIIHY